MNNFHFILYSIGSLAASFLLVTNGLSTRNTTNKEIGQKSLAGLIVLAVLQYIGISNYFYLGVILSFAILIDSLKLFVQAVNNRAKNLAINDYNNKKIEKKYDLNNTIEIINKFIYVFLLATIFLFIGDLLDGSNISRIVGILVLLVLTALVINFLIGTHKSEDKISVSSVKASLFTLISLTFIVSVLTFYILINTINQLILYPIFAFIMVVPLFLVSNYLLDRFRMTFFNNNEISEYCISNLLMYPIISLIATIILSDIVVIYSTIKIQNYATMFFWTIGFVVFITSMFQYILKKFYAYKLESNLIAVENLV